ncbi:MAG TPA: RDD family protein [Candidatus Angelobacter sp.]|nr:RDD family protein [Candidatus Angelobacter sp.]
MNSNEDAIQPWREEVISRVQEHRAKRRRRLDPSATLPLDFSDSATSSMQNHGESDQPVATPVVVRPEAPKIIEFRRPASVQPVFVSSGKDEIEDFELAEPVFETPRILEAPPVEQMDLLPAFTDIQLEPATQRTEPWVEVPPQSAALQQRAFAGLVDLLIVLVASAAFISIYLMAVRDLPQPRLVLVVTSVVSALLWLVYQYLFLVYSPGTPGMRMAQLELCTFEGGPVSRSLRRWRALASLLSCCSFGLGFAWALIDEDRLGWHDRITQTHLKTSRECSTA